MWSYFELRLIAITIFLAVDMLSTIIAVLIVSYQTQNPGSTIVNTAVADIVRKSVQTVLIDSIDFPHDFELSAYITYSSVF